MLLLANSAHSKKCWDLQLKCTTNLHIMISNAAVLNRTDPDVHSKLSPKQFGANSFEW